MHEGLRRGLRVDAVPEAEAARRALERATELAGGRRRRLRAAAGRTSTDAGAEEPYSEGIIDHLRAVDGAELVALVRELPAGAGAARKGSLRSHPDGVDVSAIARSFGGGGHRRAAGFSTDLAMDEITRRIVDAFVAAERQPRRLMAIPKALEPTGVDPRRQAGRALVVRRRRRRPARGPGAKTGHAGTLDPFATGLLVLLSGRATSLQDRFMKLDKRYVTEIDLRARTTTGDPEGEPVDEHDAAGARGARARRSTRCAARSSCAIPAASAVKIGGERAYRLHRRGVAVEMPTRVMRVHELELLVVRRTASSRLDLLVGSGTYVRSIADALGGHCVTLRRTEIGPFRVEEADEERIVPLEEALPRLASAR